MSPRWLDVDALTDEELVSIASTVFSITRFGIPEGVRFRSALAAHAAARPAPLTVERLAALLKEYEISHEPCDLGSLGHRTALAAWLLPRLGP